MTYSLLLLIKSCFAVSLAWVGLGPAGEGEVLCRQLYSGSELTGALLGLVGGGLESFVGGYDGVELVVESGGYLGRGGGVMGCGV